MNTRGDRGWLAHGAVFVALVTATCLLYRGDLELGFFHLDDASYVTSNPWIQGISATNVVHVLTTPYAANYSPLHLFSYMLDWQIAGTNARAYHMSSNIWAGIVAGCVYLLGLVLFRGVHSAMPSAPVIETEASTLIHQLVRRKTEIE